MKREFTAAQANAAFKYWYQQVGHWIYQSEAEAKKVWNESGINGLPDAPPKSNPRPRIGTAKPARASSATGKPPTKRLKARRKANSRKGYFPNPNGQTVIREVPTKAALAARRAAENKNAKLRYWVQTKTKLNSAVARWITLGGFETVAEAKAYAHHRANVSKMPVRVVDSLT